MYTVDVNCLLLALCSWHRLCRPFFQNLSHCYGIPITSAPSATVLMLAYLAVLPGRYISQSSHAQSTTPISPLSKLIHSQLCSVLLLSQGSETTGNHKAWADTNLED